MQTTTISTHITNVISKVVGELTQSPITVELEHPANAEHGDYSTNVALTTFKKLSDEEKQQFGSPRKFADEVAKRVGEHSSQFIVKSVTVAGPGFINFSIADEQLVRYVVASTAQQFSELLAQPALQEKVVVVEYSSPNIAKPFTIGHLRSTIIGNAVANIYEAMGYKVFRDNHLGDWGTQFGKQIYAFLNIPLDSTGKRSNEEVLETSTEPVKDLVQLYIEFHTQAEQRPEIEDEARAWFKKLEDGDREARRIWQKCIDWSLKEFRQIYQRLGVQFTENNGVGYGESFFEDKMGLVLAELRKKQLLTESQGAQLVFLEEEKLPPLMIVKKDGATLYATRDLATDKFRRGNVERYGKEPLVINEVGAEQAEYFQQLFAVEYRLGWYKPGERVHVKHGHFRFQDKKMSTRKGNVIWLSDVLDEAVKRAEGNEVIGLGALKWNDLKRSAHLDVVFNWEEILSMEGNSGPYMQYAYTRCASILRKAESASGETLAKFDKASIDKASIGKEERNLLRVLIQYPEVVERAAKEYAPHHICTYLFELAQRFNSFYHQCPVLQSEGAERALRLVATSSVANTLEHGLRLLGIEVPEKM